jgi:acetoin utilization deacetylase AcuC-like enzyme
MRVVYSPVHSLHDPRVEAVGGTPLPAYEVAERVEAIRSVIEQDDSFEILDSKAFGVEPIKAVHDPHLVAYLERAWREWRERAVPRPWIVPDTFLSARLREGQDPLAEPHSLLAQSGYWCFDTATPILAGTYAAARAAVDVSLTAAELLLDGQAATYALCRPPGHHAQSSQFGGYCYFNNAAIATQWLATTTAEPVCILDLDFHHGNGSQEIFYRRADVLYVSLHADPRHDYPYFTGYADETGAGAGSGTNVNLPLPPGTDDERYLAALARALDRVASFAGGILVVSLGMDTFGEDPIGDFALTTLAYHEAGRMVAATGRRLLIVQEGGYDIAHLGENVRQWLRGCQGLPFTAAGQF